MNVSRQSLEAARREPAMTGGVWRLTISPTPKPLEAGIDRSTSTGFLAALPLLLFGFGVAATSIVRGGPWYAVPNWRLGLSVAVGAIPMLVIGVGAGVALVRRLPDWGWSWVGSALIGAALLVQSVVGEAEEAGRALPRLAETGLGALFFAVGLVLLFTAAVRGWRRAALFSMVPAGTFGLSMYLAIIAGPFFRHDLALLAAPVSLVYSGLVYFFIRTAEPASILPIVAIGVLNLASYSLASTVWQAWLAAQSRSSPLIPLTLLGTGLLLAGPLAGWLLRPLRFGHAS